MSQFDDLKINAFSNEQYSVFRKFLYGCVGAITILTGAASYKIIKTYTNEQAYIDSEKKIQYIKETVATEQHSLDDLIVYKKNLQVEVVELQEKLKEKDLLNPCKESIEWFYTGNAQELNHRQMKCSHPQHEFKIVDPNLNLGSYTRYFSCTCKK